MPYSVVETNAMMGASLSARHLPAFDLLATAGINIKNFNTLEVEKLVKIINKENLPVEPVVRYLGNRYEDEINILFSKRTGQATSLKERVITTWASSDYPEKDFRTGPFKGREDQFIKYSRTPLKIDNNSVVTISFLAGLGSHPGSAESFFRKVASPELLDTNVLLCSLPNHSGKRKDLVKFTANCALDEDYAKVLEISSLRRIDVGYSTGGLVKLINLAKHRNSNGLVLFNTPIFSLDNYLVEAGVGLPGIFSNEKFQHTLGSFFKYTMGKRSFLNFWDIKRDVHFYDGSNQTTSSNNYDYIMRLPLSAVYETAILAKSARQAIKTIGEAKLDQQIPIVIVLDVLDNIASIFSAIYYKKYLPNCHLIITENSGHGSFCGTPGDQQLVLDKLCEYLEPVVKKAARRSASLPERSLPGCMQAGSLRSGRSSTKN